MVLFVFDIFCGEFVHQKGESGFVVSSQEPDQHQETRVYISDF